MTDNLLDLTVGLEVVEGLACERTVNLETIDEGGDGDQAVRLDILVELVGDVLVEDDSVLGLVLDCGLSASYPHILISRVCAVSDIGAAAARCAHLEVRENEEFWRCGRCWRRSRTLALGPLLLLLLASGC